MQTYDYKHKISS